MEEPPSPSSSSRQVLQQRENLEEDSGGSFVLHQGHDPKEGFPKPPRSAFVCFSEVMAKKEGNDGLENIAEAFRNLTPKERAQWDEVAREDKQRHAREKRDYRGSYTGPKRRAKKHPLAPKRPPSAFLRFSQHERSRLKKRYPHMLNTDISRLLGEQWRSAPTAIKQPYILQEQKEREAYKVAIKNFRSDQSRLDAASRISHQSMRYHDDHPSPPHRQQQQPYPHTEMTSQNSYPLPLPYVMDSRPASYVMHNAHGHQSHKLPYLPSTSRQPTAFEHQPLHSCENPPVHQELHEPLPMDAEEQIPDLSRVHRFFPSFDGKKQQGAFHGRFP